jgi:hypothetical protein
MTLARLNYALVNIPRYGRRWSEPHRATAKKYLSVHGSVEKSLLRWVWAHSRRRAPLMGVWEAWRVSFIHGDILA